MILTGTIVPLFAALHLAALLRRPLPQPLFAIALYAVSAALFWSAVAVTRGLRLAACFQAYVPPVVVRRGPYGFIRHPFYLAYTLTWIAGYAATGWWPLAVTALIMASLYYRAACEEEKRFMESSHGADYKAYMQAAGRFLPRMHGPAPPRR
jgi:protein-S-isoprenylcysteine O-methyltransferase Ste14